MVERGCPGKAAHREGAWSQKRGEQRELWRLHMTRFGGSMAALPTQAGPLRLLSLQSFAELSRLSHHAGAQALQRLFSPAPCHCCCRLPTPTRPLWLPQARCQSHSPSSPSRWSRGRSQGAVPHAPDAPCLLQRPCSAHQHQQSTERGCKKNLHM